MKIRTSGQDGGIGRYTLLPHITERGTTTLKRKNNQNCQKIELYASLTTRELKKKHSFRPVGGAEMGSQAERIQGEVAAGRLSEGAAGGLGGPISTCR